MKKTEPKSGDFVALVHETLKRRQFDSLADLAEEVKTRCARLHFLYDSRRVWDAIEHVDRIRKISLSPPPLAQIFESPASGPLTHDECVETLRRLGLDTNSPKAISHAPKPKIDIHGNKPELAYSYEVFWD